MKNKKVLAAGLAFCVSLQGLASCAEEERSEDVRAQIGVACYDQDDIFISELLECVEDELGLLKDDSFQAAVTSESDRTLRLLFIKTLYTARVKITPYCSSLLSTNKLAVYTAAKVNSTVKISHSTYSRVAFIACF